MFLFNVLDKTRREIRLTQESWRHIAHEHPDVTDLDEIKQTLITPLTILPSRYSPDDVCYYYRQNKEKGKYLFVAVKYLNGGGFIITAYYVRKI